MVFIVGVLLTVGVGSQVWSQYRASQATVYVEDSPGLLETLNQADRLIGEKRIADAVRIYQQIMVDRNRKLLPLDSQGVVVMNPLSNQARRYTDAGLWVRQRIETEPTLRKAYRQLYEATAQQKLEAMTHPSPWVLDQDMPTRGQAVLDDAALRELIQEYGPTHAAAQASLWRARLKLELNQPAQALDILREYMDTMRSAVDAHETEDEPSVVQRESYWKLLAQAASLIGDASTLESARTQYAQLASADELAALNQQLNEFAQYAEQGKRAELPDALPQPNLAEALSWWGKEAALWEHGLPGESGMRLGEGNFVDPGLRLPNSRIRPLLMERTLYLNDGNMIVALDQLSGRLRWQRSADERALAGVANLNMRRGVMPIEARAVASDGEVVAGVLGMSMGFAIRGMGGRGGSQLVCVQVRDGKLLWQKTPEDLDASLETAYFQGTPVLSENRLYVMARRMQVSGFSDAFVMAVNLQNGELLWRRHLSSAALVQRIALRPTAQISLHQGNLYISDYQGMVANLDAVSGAVRWLSVVMDWAAGDGDQANLQDSRVPIGHPPLLISSGLLVVSPMGVSVLLEPESGKMIRELRHEAWRQVDQVVPWENDVLLVGNAIRRLDGRTLQTKWGLTLTGQGTGALMGEAALWSEQEVLLVPTLEKLIAVGLTDGQIRHQQIWGGPGNLKLDRQQLIVAAERMVRSHMKWEQAYAQLRKDIEAQPTDVRAGLSLASLACRAQQDAAVLEGADAALTALKFAASANDSLSDEVFSTLLQLASGDQIKQPQTRAVLFDRLASASDKPVHQAAYHLAWGAFLAQQMQLAEAVDQYQMVLADQVLAGQTYQLADSQRRAGLEAQRRLTLLVEQHGLAIYDKYHQQAAQRLAELVTAQHSDARTVMQLAQIYPLASNLAEIHGQAARIWRQQKQHSQAIGQYRLAYLAKPSLERRQIIVSELAELYEELEQPRRAVTWLQGVSKDYPQLQLVRQGQAIAISQWLTQLSQQPMLSAKLPQLSAPLTRVSALEGRLLVPWLQEESRWPRDRIITLSSQGLLAYQAERGQPLTLQWRTQMPEGDVQLLWLSQEQVLLWHPQSQSIMALQAADGSPSWPALAVEPLLDEAGTAAQKIMSRPPAQRQFLEMMLNDGAQPVVINGRVVAQPMLAQPRRMMAINDQIMLLADTIGRVMAIDRTSGQTLWKAMMPMDQLTHLALDDEHLVLAGINGFQPETQSTQVMLLDPHSGEIRNSPIEEKCSLHWLGLTGEGGFIMAGGDARQQLVHAYRLDDGKPIWRTTLRSELLTGEGAANSDLLLLHTVENGMLILDSRTGVRRNRLTGNQRSLINPLRLSEADGQWQVMLPTQLAAVNEHGQHLWRDGLGDQTRQRLMQVMGEQQMLLVTGTLGDPMVGMDLNPRQRVLTPAPPKAEDAPNANAAQVGAMQRQVAGNLVIRQGRAAVQVRIAADPRGAGFALPVGNDAGAAQETGKWRYELFILDRSGGAVLSRFELGPLPLPLLADYRVLLQDRLVLTTVAGSLVVE